jgi:mannose-1-phosphate guanylyltransferase
LSCTRPKTLFPIVNKPLLQWIFERLARDGVNEAVLAINQLTELYIKQHRIPRSGVTVKYSHDPPKKPLGTAGPIKRAERLLGHEPFLVLNGDIFADISYRELMEKHLQSRASATLSLCKVEDPSRYGVAELANNAQIKSFVEKPPRGTESSKLINAGVYVLSPEVLDLIPEGRAVSMEREVFPKLASQGKLYGHVVQGLWMDIGKPEEYMETNRILLDAIKQKRKPKGSHKFTLKSPVAIDKGVAIGEESTIGPYAVLGRNVNVGKNVQIADSVIFSGTKIADAARINGAIIGEEAVIGENAIIRKGCIIADHAKILKGAKLAKSTSICPAKEVG